MALTITAQVPLVGAFGPAVRFACQVTIAPSSCTGSTTSQQTGTVTGLRSGMILVIGMAKSTTAATATGSARVSNPDELEMDFINPGATATPTSGTCVILAI